MGDCSNIIGIDKDGVVITPDNVEVIVDNVFSELEAGRATVQSRSKNYYELVVPFAKLPDELKQALAN